MIQKIVLLFYLKILQIIFLKSNIKATDIFYVILNTKEKLKIIQKINQIFVRMNFM